MYELVLVCEIQKESSVVFKLSLNCLNILDETDCSGKFFNIYIYI